MEFGDTNRLAQSLSETLPPLAVDIDGTLTGEDRGIDPRVIPVLRAWPSTLVIATGKAMPYPVSLCEFLAIEPHVIAENGGVVVRGRTSEIRFEGDREGAMAVAEEYRSRGYSLGWGEANLVNRWRETELAVSLESPLEPLESIASDHGLMVVDTGYAYHVKASDIDKGRGLTAFAEDRDIAPEAFAFVGDSPNDVPGFEVAGTGIAVANGSDSAREVADYVTDASHGEGFLEAVAWLDETQS
jgi:phosphoglycolate phosphatase (TIGR01487 family)